MLTNTQVAGNTCIMNTAPLHQWPNFWPPHAGGPQAYGGSKLWYYVAV